MFGGGNWQDETWKPSISTFAVPITDEAMNLLLIMLPPSSVIIAYNITFVLSLTCFGLVRGHLQRLIFKIIL
jgi:hypothetical protein